MYMVYLIDLSRDIPNEVKDGENIRQLPDDKFIKIADDQGGVYTLDEFAEAANDDMLNLNNSYIRFIEREE